MTPREIIDRARAAYEAARGPNEVPFDRRARVIQEAWIKNIRERKAAEAAKRKPAVGGGGSCGPNGP